MKFTQSRWLLTMLLLVAAMVVPTTLWAQSTIITSKPSVGDGTTDSPYQISTAAELYWFAGLVNGDESVCTGDVTKKQSANAVITADIAVNKDLLASLNEDGTVKRGNTVISWTPIGYNTYYKGTFDGQGHTISGLYFYDSIMWKVGLFGNNEGTIKNVSVVDSYFNGSDKVGGVCGYNINGTITNCYNSGTVSGDYDVGGVCGRNLAQTFNGPTTASITNCYNSGTVSGKKAVGGVCGRNTAIVRFPEPATASITNCYSTGGVSGTEQVGGVNGYNQSIAGSGAAIITNCYYNSETYTGDAIGSDYGIVENVTGKTTTEFASGEVAYLLSQGYSPGDTYYSGALWGQKLGPEGDSYPVLGSDYKVISAAQDGPTGTNYWATFSNLTSDADLDGLTVYKAKVSGGKLTLTECDNTVAAGEGVLVKGSYKYLNARLLNVATEAPEADNDLVATPATAQTVTADNGYTIYSLTYNDVPTKEGLGFHLGKDGDSTDGSQLNVTPDNAYLKVTTEAATDPMTSMPAGNFALPFDGDTGIECSSVTDKGTGGKSDADVIFDLTGRKVRSANKGLYLKNGRKVVIR